ncbi:hypothetical protein C1646_671833 [Rhizophagus diaphanus]|nr:hypothetical protein C1646_671833 [Rhizophagus diaphanus] [Rhizophagus sp. MUCL 43196]
MKSSEDEFDSDVYDNMDDDDLLQIDESSDSDDNISISSLITDNDETNTDQYLKKRQICNSVHSKTCSGYAKHENICNECCYIRSDKRLCTNITKRIPSPENVKFTPKYYWKDNALKEHLKNNHLRDVWNLLNDDSDCNNGSKIWIALADKALQDAFDHKPIFVELYEVMNDAVERKIKNKGKQNIKYSEEFTNFLVILEGFSTRTLDLFRQNLEG